MKAVILCAGRGTRLRPLTHTGAKHLIPVANRPLLFHVIDDLAEAGVDSICVVVSDGPQYLRDALGSGEEWDVSIEYAVQHSPKGLAHAVQTARDFVADDPFVVYLGDNIFEHGLTGFIEEAAAEEAETAVLLAPVPDPERFGVAQLDNSGRLTAVEEKPADPPTNLALTGAYRFSPAIFDSIEQIRPSARGELEITDAIQHLIANGHPVGAHEVEGWWRDAGLPHEVLDVNRLLLEALPAEEAVDPFDMDCQIEGRVYFEDGATVQNSLIRGPAIIGAGCTVRDSFVGPFTSIGEGSTLRQVEIQNTIVMPHCEINSVPVRIDSSVFGEEARLSSNGAVPSGGSQFVLGDHSQISLSAL